jgi:hypothetical protein
MALLLFSHSLLQTCSRLLFARMPARLLRYRGASALTKLTDLAELWIELRCGRRPAAGFTPFLLARALMVERSAVNGVSGDRDLGKHGFDSRRLHSEQSALERQKRRCGRGMSEIRPHCRFYVLGPFRPQRRDKRRGSAGR